MLAPLDGLHRREGMMMIGSGDDDPVDLLHLVEHLPVVGELLCLGILLEDMPGVALIHIAQRHDVLALHLAQIVSPLPANADARQVELPVRRRRPAQARRHHEGSRGQCGPAQELTAGERGVSGADFRFHKPRLQETAQKGQCLVA